MTGKLHRLATSLRERFSGNSLTCDITYNEVTVVVPPQYLREVCIALRDEDPFQFELLIDLAGVDYLEYGIAEWTTDSATATGFSRGVDESTFGRFSFDDAPHSETHEGPRFAVAYQLLSLIRNQRLRVKVFCESDDIPMLDSVIEIWASANWYEREAFDLYGIVFQGHPDLRRILTDYGFIGHPFRKDFPLIGHVEMRYDPEQQRVVYQPVSIEPRVLVPKEIPDDHRYIESSDSEGKSDA